MATTINNVLAINIQGISSATVVANRTFTTTRSLRVFDLKAFPTAAPAASVTVYTVNNAATPIITVTTPNPAVIDTVYRAGNEVAATTCNDAAMTVAAAGTIIFGVDVATVSNLTAVCYPL
jgi:hypothetical protein